jgi:hypothetical protein
MVTYQEPPARFSAAGTRNHADNRYILRRSWLVPALRPSESETRPIPSWKPPAATRVMPETRRWRYSHGLIRRCTPGRGGDSHHPRRLFAAVAVRPDRVLAFAEGRFGHTLHRF